MGRNKILNGEYYFVLNIEISNTAEDLIDSFYKNDLTNKTGDQYNSNMSTINILLYQDVHDNAFMQRVLHQDVYDFDSNDDPIAIMQQFKEEYYSKYNNNLCTDDQRWYSTTTTNDDTIADVHKGDDTTTIMQLVIRYQINYKTIQPYHLKRNCFAKQNVMNDNNKTISNNGKYDDEYYLYRDNSWYDNNNNKKKKKKNDDNNDTSKDNNVHDEDDIERYQNVYDTILSVFVVFTTLM